jgi:hypothetical protein
LNEVQVAQVYPRFPNDSNTKRICLIDPAWTPGAGAGLLPYVQPPEGVPASTTNAPTPNTRLMVVSNTRRELALPFGSGAMTAGEFQNLWEWTYDPAVKAPPSGWPASWNGKADGLHVRRLDLADWFHVLTLKNLLYRLNGSYPLQNVTDEVRRHILRGSLLEVFHNNGGLYADFIVNRDRTFDLSNPVRALLYYKLDESGGTLGSNSGRAGSSADVTYVSSPILGQAGPAVLPPSNQAVRFNGNGDVTVSSFNLPSALEEFTLAGWIQPTGNMENNEGIMGERDVMYFKSKDEDEITLVTFASGSVTFDYDFPNNSWHHIAAVGDGSSIKIYVDGSLIATHLQAVADYGNPSSADFFRLAGEIVSASDYFKGVLDEVVFYDEALTASEVSQLTVGAVP